MSEFIARALKELRSNENVKIYLLDKGSGSSVVNNENAIKKREK